MCRRRPTHESTWPGGASGWVPGSWTRRHSRARPWATAPEATHSSTAPAKALTLSAGSESDSHGSRAVSESSQAWGTVRRPGRRGPSFSPAAESRSRTNPSTASARADAARWWSSTVSAPRSDASIARSPTPGEREPPRARAPVGLDHQRRHDLARLDQGLGHQLHPPVDHGCVEERGRVLVVGDGHQPVLHDPNPPPGTVRPTEVAGGRGRRSAGRTQRRPNAAQAGLPGVGVGCGWGLGAGGGWVGVGCGWGLGGGWVRVGVGWGLGGGWVRVGVGCGWGWV